MFSLEILIFASAVFFCIGGIVGALVSRASVSPAKQKDLESQLSQSRAELDKYQQDVAQHFAETSQLVSQLTQSYKEVHDHLAKGAIQLTNAEISKQILEAGDSNLGIEAKDNLDSLEVEPPKDWAPKTPGQKGVLSEDFGFEEETSAETLQPTSSSNTN